MSDTTQASLKQERKLGILHGTEETHLTSSTGQEAAHSVRSFHWRLSTLTESKESAKIARRDELSQPRRLTLPQLLELAVFLSSVIDLFFFVTDHLRYPKALYIFAVLFSGLIAIILINPKSLFRKIAKRLVHIFEPDPFIVWFIPRDSAGPDMHRVWRMQQYLGFIGLSQESLHKYLEEELSRGRPLPWQSIDVFFASDDLGEIFEENQFRSNIRRNWHNIATKLTEPSHAKLLAGLKEVRFYQMDNITAGYTGSVYGTSRESPTVFYVVLSLPKEQGVTQKSLTFRVDQDGTESWNSARKAVLEHYREGFQLILERSRLLDVVRPSVWDLSAMDWNVFCRESPVMDAEMMGLIDIAGQVGGRTVLDVGCGTGELSKLLLRSAPRRVVALDRSPQMLLLAKQQLPYSGAIHFALCNVPTSCGENPERNLDLEDQRFQLIFLHQVLPPVASDRESLVALANWCRSRLAPDGKIALAAHDGAVKIDKSPWDDPFRNQLAALAKANPALLPHLRRPQSKLDPEEVESAFMEAGLTLTATADKRIGVTMNDRALLWHVPAILDSFVDVRAVGVKEAQKLAHEAAALVSAKPTKQRAVRYWIFSPQAKETHGSVARYTT